MKLDEALNLLGQVCAAFRGNLEEHRVLQEALKTVTNRCKPKKEKKNKKTEK